jgi:hypothetical protein
VKISHYINTASVFHSDDLRNGEEVNRHGEPAYRQAGEVKPSAGMETCAVAL